MPLKTMHICRNCGYWTEDSEEIQPECCYCGFDGTEDELPNQPTEEPMTDEPEPTIEVKLHPNSRDSGVFIDGEPLPGIQVVEVHQRAGDQPAATLTCLPDHIDVEALSEDVTVLVHRQTEEVTEEGDPATRYDQPEGEDIYQISMTVGDVEASVSAPTLQEAKQLARDAGIDMEGERETVDSPYGNSDPENTEGT